MKLKFLLPALFLSSLAYGQGSFASFTVQTPTGNAIAGASVALCTSLPNASTPCGNSTLQNTYVDITVAVQCTKNALVLGPLNGAGCTNPGYTDNQGNAQIFALGGLNYYQAWGYGIANTYVSPLPFPALTVGVGTINNINAINGLAGGGIGPSVSIGLITSCPANNVLLWNGATWNCSTAGTGTLTGATTAGTSGLIGGGLTGTLALSMRTDCSSTQILAWSGTSWNCGTNGTGTVTGVTATTGGGLVAGGTLSAPSLGLITTCGNNQVLSWNGASWVCAALGGGGTPGGSNTQVQINNSGAFAGYSFFTVNSGTSTVNMTNGNVSNQFTVAGPHFINSTWPSSPPGFCAFGVGSCLSTTSFGFDQAGHLAELGFNNLAGGGEYLLSSSVANQNAKTLNIASLNPNGATLTMLAVGVTYPTLHDAIAACPSVGCIVFDTVTENLTNNSAGNPVQPFCSGTWVATAPYTCTGGSWKFATVYLGFGKWTSDYQIIYGSSYEHIQGAGVSVGGGGATTGTIIASTAAWDQTGPDPGHPLIRLSPLFTGANYQFNNTLKDLTLDMTTGSAAGKVGECVVNDGADEQSIVQNVKCYAVKPPTATSVVQTVARASNIVTVTVTNVQGCNGNTNPCQLQNGQQIILAGTAGMGTPVNGTWTAKTVSGTPTTSFTFAQTGPDETGTPATGTAKIAGEFVAWLGNGAQNSKLDELYFLSGSVGYQDANTNGILMSTYSTRGINGTTMVMGNGTTPNAGILVTGGSTDPIISNTHCEGWTHCAQYTNSAGGEIHHLTVGNTVAGDAVNIGSSVIALSLYDVNINVAGTLSLLTDNNFTTPFVAATSTAHLGYYLLGSTGSGLHTWWTDLKVFADPQSAFTLIEQTAPTVQAVTVQVQDVIYGSSVDNGIHIKNSSDTLDRLATRTIGSGTSTSNGTIINSGTSQAQPAITVTGAATTDAAQCSLNAAPPATWQTGIQILTGVVTLNTVTPWLSNPTAGNITPAATAIRCTVTR